MFRRISIALVALSALAQPPQKPRQPVPQIAYQWLNSLTLRDRVAQLISMAVYGENPATRSRDYQKFRHWVADLHIGGLIVNNRVIGGQVRNAEPYASATFLNRMQRLARIPLIIQGDFERGPSMRVSGTPKFPYNMAFGAAGDVEASRFEGAETAREARALGFHWIFAPDADVNNNPDNPIINIRSYGEDPATVAAHVKAYIEGAHSDPANRVLVTVKHFPGHGDTNVDSHLGLGRVGASRERMDAVELPPFKTAIEAGVDSVMTAHLAVPAIEPEEIPATVSQKVITGLLREELGFKGIVVTDAMDMQGLTKLYGPAEASVLALEAGVDVLLMPTDPEKAIDAVVKAVKEGRLTRKRIDQSALKVLTAKANLGLYRRRYVNLEALADVIENPDVEERVQSVANRALTLLRNGGDVVPLKDPDHSCVVVLTENRYSQQGRQLIADLRQRSPQAMKIRVLDPTSSQADLADAAALTSQCKAVVIAAFVTVSAYRGNVALPGEFPALVSGILEAPVPAALLAFGNPYLLRAFPKAPAYLATFSTTSTSESAAARALLGDIPIKGKLPVSIPGQAQIGDGIQKEIAIQ